jgi:hypothetical protein
MVVDKALEYTHCNVAQQEECYCVVVLHVLNAMAFCFHFSRREFVTK